LLAANFLNFFMNILIIGARGMLGQYMAQVFTPPNPPYQGGDDDAPPIGGVELTLWDKEDLDITDEKQVNTKITQLKPGVIINCASYNDVDGSESNIELANIINGYAVGYLAQAAKDIDAILVHFSTGYIFKGDNKEGYTEDDQPDPQSAYGVSKLLGERELQKYTSKYYIIRTSRLFGKQGKSEVNKKPFTDLIIETAVKNNYKIKAVDEEYDLPTYALDLARETKKIIRNSSLVMGAGGINYGIYHISNSGKPCTWYGFAKEIFKIKNIKVEIEAVDGDAFGKRPAKRPKYAAMKNTKLKPLRSWQEALEEYLG
jgi:dTDP-4-dehydrorhamnose reductase